MAHSWLMVLSWLIVLIVVLCSLVEVLSWLMVLIVVLCSLVEVLIWLMAVLKIPIVASAGSWSSWCSSAGPWRSSVGFRLSSASSRRSSLAHGGPSAGSWWSSMLPLVVCLVCFVVWSFLGFFFRLVFLDSFEF